MKDNWKNKPTGMICSTCMFYVNTRCRRHAPTMQGYPAVFKEDWCGDHKLDKSTINDIESESNKHVLSDNCTTQVNMEQGTYLVLKSD